MRWKQRKQTISPINRQLETALLKKAYLSAPENPQFLQKLVHSLTYQNRVNEAVDICSTHLHAYPSNKEAYSLLSFLLIISSKFETLIDISKSSSNKACEFPKNFTLHLANAYIQIGDIKKAEEIIFDQLIISDMNIAELRMAFDSMLKIKRTKEVCSFFESLDCNAQLDSGLRAHYIHALSIRKSEDKNEPALLSPQQYLNYTDIVKKYTVNETVKDLDLTRFNQQLSDFFLSNTQQQSSPVLHTLTNGTRLHFETDWHENLLLLEEMLKTSVEDYLNLKNVNKLLPVKDMEFSLNLWATILNKQGYHESHIHPNALISGVYYVKVPSSVSQPNKAPQGWLTFCQPALATKYSVKPEEGLFVLFPSYLHHQTIPLSDDETRISIAFDIVTASA